MKIKVMKRQRFKKFLLNINKFVINRISENTYKEILVTYVLLFLLGRVISLYQDMELSIIHQLNLTIISIVELNILKEFYLAIAQLLDELHGRNQKMYSIIKKLSNRIYSIYNISIPIIFCSIFAWVIMFLEYLPSNLMGYFGLFMATSSFFFALIAYYALVCTLHFFYVLSKLPYKELFNVHPNDTIRIPNWLKIIIDLFFKAKTSVFTVGLLYTIEYLLLVPSSSMEFVPTLKINSEYPIIFLYNWVVIAVFVIIACPIMMALFKKVLCKIIQNAKQNAVDYIDLIWNQTVLDMKGILSYQQTIQHLSSTGMYHMPNKNIYPIITTSLAFVLNMLKLLEFFSFPM